MTTATSTRPLTIPAHLPPPYKARQQPVSQWSREDIAAQPARYLAWLKKIDTAYWLALNHPRSQCDYDTAINVCRAYKAQYAEYTRQGIPATLRPQLNRQAQV